MLFVLLRECEFRVWFANFEDPGGSQWRYFGAAWMAMQNDNDSSVTIEPLRVERFEQRGPRTYTLGVAAPGPRIPLPRAIGIPNGVTR